MSFFGIMFMHTMSPGNREDCMEAQLSTQANLVGAIQSKARSQRILLLVIEQSHSYNGHILLTHYSGDSIEMSRQSFREGNF